MESQRNENATNENISLKSIILKIYDWIRYLSSKWVTIIIFCIIGGALGFTYAHFKKTVFTAITTFVLEDEKSANGLGNLAGLASMAGVDIASGGGIFQGDNIISLYKSRLMLTKTLLTRVDIDGKRQLLIDRYLESKDPKIQSDVKSNSKLSFSENKDNDFVIPPNRMKDSVLANIVLDINKNYLNVYKPDKKLSSIVVEVKSYDEEFAKAFNDALVKNVNNFYIDTKTKKTLKNINILQHKTDSVRAAMNGEIYSAVAVVDATPNLNPTRQVQRVAPAQRAQFSAETNKAVLGEMVKNLEISKMTFLKETPLIQIIDEPILPLPKKQLGIKFGILLGMIIFCFLACVYLVISKVWHES